MEDPPESAQVHATFILDVLHDASTHSIQESTDLRPGSSDPTDIMDLYLSRDKIAISEFELLQLLLAWCEKRGLDTTEYIHLVNSSAMSDKQRVWSLDRTPPSMALTRLVRNSLLQSKLVLPEELRRFLWTAPNYTGSQFSSRLRIEWAGFWQRFIASWRCFTRN